MKPVVPVSVGKGGEPIHFNQISQNELDELAKFQPTLTYGQAKQVRITDGEDHKVGWQMTNTGHFGVLKLIKRAV